MNKWNKIKTLSGRQAMRSCKILISKTERAGCLTSSASHFQHGCWVLNRCLVYSSASWIIRVDTNRAKICFVHCVRPFPFSRFSKRPNSLQGKQTECYGVVFPAFSQPEEHDLAPVYLWKNSVPTTKMICSGDTAGKRLSNSGKPLMAGNSTYVCKTVPTRFGIINQSSFLFLFPVPPPPSPKPWSMTLHSGILTWTL